MVWSQCLLNVYSEMKLVGYYYKVHERNMNVAFRRMLAAADHFKPDGLSYVSSVVLSDSKDCIPAGAIIFGVGITLNGCFHCNNAKRFTCAISTSEKDDSILADNYL